MEIMRDLLMKIKINVWDILAGNYLQKNFKRLYCDCVISSSTRRLVGSGSDYTGNAFEVCTEESHPDPVPLDNVG